MTTKSKKLINGSLLRSVDFFANALVGIVMMPFIIHALGDRMYGLWIFVGSFLGYYGLMDFGLNSAVQRYLSKAIGARDTDEENKIVNTALGIFTVIGGLVLILTIAGAFLVPIAITNITEVALFRKLLLILGINFAIGFPLRVFTGILGANLRFELSSMVDISKLIFRTMLIYYFLAHGYGVLALAIITAVMDIYAYSIKFGIVKKNFKHIVVTISSFDRSKIRSLFGYSIYTFISQIANQLRFNVDNLVITAFVALSSVTPFSIGSRFISYLMDFLDASTGMLTPLFSQYEAAKQHDLLKEKFLFLTKIVGYLTFLISGLLAIFAKAFIIRWVGVEYSISYTIMLILLFPMALALMQGPSVQLLYGISKHKFFAISNSLEGVANILLSLALVKPYGIVGVAIGTALPMMIVKMFVQPVYTCRAIQLDMQYYYFKILLTIVMKSSLVLLILWFAVKQFIVPNYLMLLSLAVPVSVVFLVTIFFFGFNRAERDYFLTIARKYI